MFPIAARPKFRMKAAGVAGVVGPPPVVTADAKSVFAPNGNSQPINIGAGDLVVIVIAGYQQAALRTASSPNLGAFTSAFYTSGGGQVLWAVNAGGALTGEVITLDAAQATWHVYSISGANNAAPFDGYVSNPDVGGSHASDVSITTTHAADLIFANAIGPGSWDGGWTAAPAGQTAYGEVNEYKAVSAVGTYTAWAGQTGGDSFIFAVKGT